MLKSYTIESALTILNKGERIFYLGLDNQVKSLKIKKEKLGYTFLFGEGFDKDNVIARRWFVNGSRALVNSLAKSRKPISCLWARLG